MNTAKLNILLTSVGRRGYLVKYFQESLGMNGEIFVANSSPITPVFEITENHVVTPLIYDKEYIPFLLKYCIDNKISAIISLFDIDLPILSTNKEKFEGIGVTVIVSSINVINICNDKWKTYLFCKENELKVPRTYLSVDAVKEDIKSGKLSYPVIIKPRWGMGSIAIYEADSHEELDLLYKKAEYDIMNSYLKYESDGNKGCMVLIQEKLVGDEYGLDVINDLSGNYQNTIVKRKLGMRAGETDCAETVENDKLKKIGESLSKKLHHIANLDVDMYYDGKDAYILELNARFGGGYPFSHMAGVNLPLAIVKWLRNETVDISLLSAKPWVLSHKDIELVKINNNC